jgi:predicted RNA-binding protein YlxR (DUF448 family)/ribosomal protein L30E
VGSAGAGTPGNRLRGMRVENQFLQMRTLRRFRLSGPCQGNFAKNTIDCKRKLSRSFGESGLILCKDLFIFGLMEADTPIEPMRQCMACRKNDLKRNLLRIVRLPSGAIEFDPMQNKDGRGAYLCAETRCLSESREAGLIGRHLHVPDAAGVYLAAAEFLKPNRTSSAERLVGFAVRAGCCAFGVEAVEIEAKRKRIRLLVLCRDAGADTCRRIQALAERHAVPLTVFGGERTLGDAVGKPNCRILGVRDPKFAEAILSAASRTEGSRAEGPGRPVRDGSERSDER